MRVEREDERLIIKLSAPGVSANSFNVLIEGSKLVLYTLLVSTSNRQVDDGGSQRLAVPMFLRVLDIPSFVDADQIEAVHERGQVLVTLPLKMKSICTAGSTLKTYFKRDFPSGVFDRLRSL